MRENIRIPVKFVVSILLLCLAYVLGWTFASYTYEKPDDVSVSASTEQNWGLSFPTPGKTPVGNATPEKMAEQNAYYVDTSGEKVIYLTFDAGYENGNTAKILDALKKHEIPATFFLVGNYISTSPSKEAFSKELTELEEQYKELTGEDMVKFYRPPRGVYSEANLALAKEMGYRTFFWSLAYVDWYENNQPEPAEAFEKLLSRIHPGAIVLLHSTSRTNADILDELLTRWEEMGYSFRPLTEFPFPA